MIRIGSIIFLLILSEQIIEAQCCASHGNPIGGTVNIGLLDKNIFRIASFYRISYSDKYFIGDKLYTGEIGTLKRAVYNYIGLLVGYGITDKISFGLETGYFINKTHVYKINNESVSSHGLSDIVISFRPKIYHNSDKQIEINCALGPNIPFSRNLQRIDGVTLSRDLQPSTGSFGLVFQSNIIKEDSFRSLNFLLVNRIEKYFENKQHYIYGNTFSNSLYFSKFFPIANPELKGLTAILQLKNQIREKNIKEGQFVDASGSCLFFLIPQINLSIKDNWNFFILSDIPIYQYYNEIQFSKNTSFAVGIIKDYSLNK